MNAPASGPSGAPNGDKGSATAPTISAAPRSALPPLGAGGTPPPRPRAHRPSSPAALAATAGGILAVLVVGALALFLLLRWARPALQTAKTFVTPLSMPSASPDPPVSSFVPPETPEGLLASLASEGIVAKESDFVSPSIPRNRYFQAAKLELLDSSSTPVRYRWVPIRALEATPLHGSFSIVATLANDELYARAITYAGKRPLVAAQDARNPLVTYHLFACTRQLHSIVVRSRSRRNLTLYPLRHERCEPSESE